MANYNSAKQKAYDVILHLVDNFQNGIKSKNETETRRYYIDKFFEALGWDVGNEKGKREVIHEDIVKVKGKTKFPDYGFYFKGKRVFFVEAKDTKVDIKNDSRPAFQLRSYAWSAKLGVSILTDFEEFAVYDCTVRPKENDRTEAARIKYFTYEDYLKEGVFDYIYDLFERENVANGSLDAYSENLCNRKGSETVDVHFLSTLDELRTKLAVVISKLNREMSEKDINYAVQQIIDRIIFLRVAEDRNVENYGLLALANPKNKNEDDFKNYGFNGENSYYENLNYIFDRANEKYNSGLFDEDAIVRNLNIDDKTIKEIIDELYTPKNPYQFSVIPVEIIGNAYEQFLGKTISIDKNHKAVIELKPEVRKAGGVYYTPEYIVDYIVANTVGEAIKGKTPDEIVNIKILDPACGSGSFLLGAYKYLLNYHKEYFLKNKTKKYMGSRYEIIDESGNLALWVRKQILINNIFGVDIDSNAVEVAKLSLLLKSFEDSFNVNEYGQGSLLNEKILPSLDNNIKCGNSLIGNDFYESHLDLDDATLYKINCFDWNSKFRDIMKTGGFDVVIGNPPYFNIQTLGHNSPIANYITSKYSNIWQDKSDILFYFLYKAIKLSKSYVGFIISNSFMYADKAKRLRNFILDETKIKHIVNFEKYMVFKDASITTSIVICDKEYDSNITKALSLPDKNYDDIEKIITDKSSYIDVEFYKDENFVLENKILLDFLNKIKNNSSYLKDILHVGKGMETAANEVYLFNEVPKDFPQDYIKERMSGEMISRYYTSPTKEYLLYIEDVADFSKLPISIQEYLKSNKNILEKRATVSYEGRLWWKYSRPMHRELYNLNKIWSSYRGTENKFTLDETSNFIGLTNTTVIFKTNDDIDLKYILALLNSKLLNFYHHKIAKQTGGGVYEYVPNVVGKLPVHIVDINNKDDKEMHDKIVMLVDNIIALNKKLSVEKNPNSITMLNRQINAVDKQIDALVYKLYNLSDEEIKIIEGD